MRWSDYGYFCDRMNEEKKLQLEKVEVVWLMVLSLRLDDLQKIKLLVPFFQYLIYAIANYLLVLQEPLSV